MRKLMSHKVFIQSVLALCLIAAALYWMSTPKGKQVNPPEEKSSYHEAEINEPPALPPGKPVPDRLKPILNRLCPKGWSCESLDTVRGYSILAVQTPVWGYVVVVDPNLRVVLRAKGWYKGGNGLYRVADLTGDGRAEVILETYSGGVHCCTTYYVCSLSPFRLLVAIDAGNYGITEITDLNRDGKQEIIVADDSFADYIRLSYTEAPALPMILTYRKGRFVDASADFPQVIRKDIQTARDYVKKAGLDNVCDTEDIPERYYQGAILHWFADSVILGEQNQTMQEIRRTAAPCAAKWLETFKAEIISIVKERGEKISYSVIDQY